MDAEPQNKTDVYSRNPNPASPSRGKCEEGISPGPHLPRCFPTGLCSARAPLWHPELSTASRYHYVQQFAFAVFSGERDSCCNLARGPELKGSSYRASEVPPPSELWGSGLFNAFLPGLAPSANLSAKNTQTSALWHFTSNIYSVLEFAKALPSHLSLVPRETPAPPPEKLADCSLLPEPGAPKSQMADGEGLTTLGVSTDGRDRTETGPGPTQLQCCTTRDQIWVLQNGSQQPESTPQPQLCSIWVTRCFFFFFNLEMSPKKSRFQAFV